MDNHTLAPPRTHRTRRNGLAFVAAVCFAGVGLAATAPLTATAAAAQFSAEVTPFATHGHGYDLGDGFIGQEMINGVATFCLEITAAPPTGDSVFLGNQAWGSMSADDNARVNWAVSNYGQMPDNNWAAATHLFVWSLADTAEYNSHGMSGDDYYVARAPRSERADVLAKLAQIRADAGSITAGQQGGGSGEVSMIVDSSNNYTGTIEVSGLDPADATGTITLTNGIFTDTGSSTIAGVVNGMVLNVRGNPEDGVTEYKIGGSASFSKDTGYAGVVGLYQTAGGAQQHTAGPGPRSSVSFDMPFEDPSHRTTVFQPVVTSQMQQTLIPVGGTITDQATCEIAEDSITPEWRTKRDGSGVVVNWDVAFYPKEDQENDLPEVPEGREPIGTGTATCDGVGDVMEVSVEKPAGLTGAVTAVWSMNLASQDEATAATLQADWHDAFGLAAETSVAPRVTTKAVPSVYDGEEYGDTAVHTDVELYPETAVQTFTSYKIVDGQNVCDASTVFTDESAPILVDGRTEVTGPTFIASPEMGEGVNWIERTYEDDTKTVLLSEGVCGEAGEQTLRKVKPITPPDLAKTGADMGALPLLAGGAILAGAGLFAARLIRRNRHTSTPTVTTTEQ